MLKKKVIKPLLLILMVGLMQVTYAAGTNEKSQSNTAQGPYFEDCELLEDAAYKECLFMMDTSANKPNPNNQSNSTNNSNCVIYAYPGGFYAYCW